MLMRTLLFTVILTITIAGTSYALPPPLPEDELAYADGASSYATVDAKEAASINAQAMRWAYTQPTTSSPAGLPPPVDLPPQATSFGKVVDCSDANTRCLAFARVAVSLSRQVKPDLGARWQSGPWSFEVKACTSKCRVRMIHFEGAEGRGWFAWSPTRGVEAFARESRDGAVERTLFLTSDEGLLKH
jgi:hypothetical protein